LSVTLFAHGNGVNSRGRALAETKPTILRLLNGGEMIDTITTDAEDLLADKTVRDNPDTLGIASFVANLRYEQIPGEVIERIKLLMLDSLGCAIFGTGLEWSRILIETLAAVDSSASCGIWASGRRLSAPHAALANGTLVQSFELDDVHRQGVLHVGAVTLPPLLAVAELRPGMSGRDLLTAAVAGYEIGPRVGMCMGQEHIVQGWHSGATVGVFSAAASAAAALRLPVDKVVHALGIAGTQAAGLMAAQYGAMVKRMHAGRSAQSGLYGALLAERGFTGITNVFESAYGGFCTTFSRSQDRFDRAELTAGLGERFETMRISLKFYSCVGTNHTTLDAIRLMQARRPFGPDDVERIVVLCSQATLEHAGWTYHPEGMTSAQLNLSYCVAVLMLEGDVFVDQFSETTLDDPRRLALADRVEVREDPAITARGSKHRHTVHVTVRLRDGTTLEETVEMPRGGERHFPGASDVMAKFIKLAGRVLPRTEIERLVETTLEIDRLPDVRALLTILMRSPPC
jgi:aconitate decarboxylase